jgi:hypothetical protein
MKTHKQARGILRVGAAIASLLTGTVASAQVDPTVSILAPASGSQFLPGTAVPVQVLASDADGLISNVNFYLNGILIDGVGSAPFRTEIALPSIGSYELIAEAVDNSGAVVQSAPVNLIAGPRDETTPRIVIDFPLPLGEGDTVNDVSYASAMFINATATDPDGTVENVQFYINGQLLGDAESSIGNVYSFFYDPNAQGSYVISASAEDNDGNIGWSVPLLLDVGPLERPLPRAEMIPTVPGAIVGQQVLITVEASGGLIPINRVDFFANGVFLESKSEPDTGDLYSVVWVPEEPGTYDLQTRVVQIDPAEAVWDNWRISEPVSITVSDPEPGSQVVVDLLSPADGEVAIGLDNLFLQATGVDPLSTIQEVRFYVNNTQVGVSDSVYPYSAFFEPVSPGRYFFQAELISDRGIRAFSNVADVRVVETDQPSGQLISPSGVNPTAGSDVLVEFEANDPDGFVQSVSIFVNGEAIGGEDVDEPFAQFWRPGAPGNYQVSALITDNSGNQTYVQETITVGDPVGIVPRVTLSVTASGNVTPGSRVVVRANVFDDDPDNLSVTFFQNGAQLAPADTEAPFSIIVDPELLASNFYSITAVAADSDGNSRADTLVPLYVSDVTVDQPSVEIVSIDQGEQLTIGSRTPIRAQVLGGAKANLDAVVFYADGVEVGRDSTEPYSFDWIPDRIGNVQVTAATLQQTELYDHDNNIETAEIEVTPVNVAVPINVTVNPAVGVLPSISLDVQPANTNLAIGSRVLLYAEAQDLDGSVDSVDFFLNGINVGTDTDAPFTLPLTTTVQGDQLLNAVARDNSGNVVTSTFVGLGVEPRVITQTPVIDLTVPESGQEGSNLTLLASTEGFVTAPAGVVFYVNGQPVGSSNSIPYTFNWLANLSGDLTFFATASQTLFDGTIVTAVSEVSNVFLTDNSAPSITLVDVSFQDEDIVDKPNPFNGDDLTFRVEVDDNAPAESVQLLENGRVVGSSDSGTSPYFIDLPSPGIGQYEYSIVVTDRGGLSAQSQVILINVVSGPTDNPPVILSFSNNLPGSVARLNQEVTWSIDVDDDNGVASVKLFKNGTEVETEALIPLEVTDAITTLGRFRYFAQVTDTAGQTTNSETVEITATRGSEPVVTIVEPESGVRILPDGGGVVVRAVANPSDEPAGVPGGRIASVQFLLNGSPLGQISNPPYIFEVSSEDTVSGNNVVVAIATTDTGLSSTSGEVVIDQVEGSIPKITQFTSDALSGSGLVGTPITFTTGVTDANGVELVELLLFDEVVATSGTEPYTLSYTPLAAGSFTFTVRATNVDGNETLSDPLTISVRFPDPLGSNADFVYQSYLDILFRTPTVEELSDFTTRIDTAQMTRSRFLRELMVPPEGFVGSEYSVVRGVLLAHHFLLGGWPDRLTFGPLVVEAFDAAINAPDSLNPTHVGLAAAVASLLPMAESRYVETVNGDPLYGLTSEVTGFPSMVSPIKEVEAYVTFLFLEKYGFEPNNSQMNLSRLYFLTEGRDPFTAQFIDDVEVFGTGGSYITVGLGIPFKSADPPSDRYLMEADAASLLANLLRIDPTEEEVSALADQLFAAQVEQVLADSRYANRFTTAFAQLEHHSDGWKYSDWFGWFNTASAPWVYHTEQGWLSFPVAGSNPESFWYFDASLGWVWTQSEMYPVIYSLTEGRWLGSTRSPYNAEYGRWFLDLESLEWIQR